VSTFAGGNASEKRERTQHRHGQEIEEIEQEKERERARERVRGGGGREGGREKEREKTKGAKHKTITLGGEPGASGEDGAAPLRGEAAVAAATDSLWTTLTFFTATARSLRTGSGRRTDASSSARESSSSSSCELIRANSDCTGGRGSVI